MSRPCKQSGFSLVELSIVLVILGLLVGGILGGQSLIRAAELRNITVEYQTWQTAVNSFRQRYHALPGDFNKATQFWGSAGAKCPLWTGSGWSKTVWNDGALSTDGRTCSGNGNGKVDTDTYLELFTFWQHLGNAGLVQGGYNAFRSSDEFTGRRGESFPASKASSNALWQVNIDMLDAMPVPNPRPVALYLFKAVGNTGILTPEEAWGIDSKMDDGRALDGAVRYSLLISDMTCIVDEEGNDFTGTGGSFMTLQHYNLQNKSHICNLSFSM